jgi:hypothetical protein
MNSPTLVSQKVNKHVAAAAVGRVTQLIVYALAARGRVIQ